MIEIICPKGHKVTAEQLTSVVSCVETDIDKAITFVCPNGHHSFNLKAAIKSKTFNPEQAEKIRAGAQVHRAKFTGRGIN